MLPHLACMSIKAVVTWGHDASPLSIAYMWILVHVSNDPKWVHVDKTLVTVR